MNEDDLETEPLLPEDLDAIPVYPIIHLVKADVEHYIDTPLSYEVLMGPDLTYSLVQPLYEKYSRMQNLSTVFCFLLNRVHFLRDRALSSMPLSVSRASLCEIIAIKLLRDGAENTMQLATVMTTSWFIYSGAGPDVIAKADESTGDVDIEERVGNALEMAIIGQAKRFIKSAASQKVIDGIWSGHIVYQAESDHSFLSDTYKRTPIHFYNPRKAPLLDHYRLKVPAVRSVLEYVEFVALFLLYVYALENNDINKVNVPEAAFMVFALGFTLDKVAAMQEHGMKVYSANLWNAFDVMFITIFATYGSFRTYGIQYDQLWAKNMGIDVLALGACLMFPRLAFVTLSNNLMILSLRSMFYEFVVLMLVAAFCFCGFLYALYTLGKSSTPSYGVTQISWWMLDLYFGLDASGFDKATTFHPVFGPILMVVYTCLSNTLLLTVLVSILSHTFSTISSDAFAESMFRRAVSTVEGVKADALFSYLPPLNLFAFALMLPMSYILNRRWFHKLNVFMIRVTSFPVLLAIAVYERQKMAHQASNMRETIDSIMDSVFDSLPKKIRRLTIFESIVGTGHDIDTVFDVEEELQEEAESRRLSKMLNMAPNGTISSGYFKKDPDKEDNAIGKINLQDYSAPTNIPVPAAAPAPASEIASPADVPERASPASQVLSASVPDQPALLHPSISAPLPSLHDRHLQRERERRKSQRRDRRPSMNALDTDALFHGLLHAGGAQEYTPSPLAQIFHPILISGPGPSSAGHGAVVDSADEEALTTGDEDGEGMSSAEGPGSATGNMRSVSGGARLQGTNLPISFGPASRRISMSRSQKRSQMGGELGNGFAEARRRTQSAAGPNIRPGLLSPRTAAAHDTATEDIDHPSSAVRKGASGSHPFPKSQSLEPETVTEIEGEDQDGMTMGSKESERVWRQRLEDMESRQVRMEKLLERIEERLAGGGVSKD